MVLTLDADGLPEGEDDYEHEFACATRPRRTATRERRWRRAEYRITGERVDVAITVRAHTTALARRFVLHNPPGDTDALRLERVDGVRAHLRSVVGRIRRRSTRRT